MRLPTDLSRSRFANRAKESNIVSPVPRADLLRVDPSNLVGVLNDLEDAGLIVRSRDRADRRRGIIELTDQGGRVLQELDRALHGIDDAVLSVLSERERATLNGLLARAVEAAAVQCTEQPEPGC